MEKIRIRDWKGRIRNTASNHGSGFGRPKNLRSGSGSTNTEFNYVTVGTGTFLLLVVGLGIFSRTYQPGELGLGHAAQPGVQHLDQGDEGGALHSLRYIGSWLRKRSAQCCGSGSTSQRYGSGSGSGSRSGSFYHQAKIIRKIWNPIILWLFLTFYLNVMDPEHWWGQWDMSPVFIIYRQVRIQHFPDLDSGAQHVAFCKTKQKFSMIFVWFFKNVQAAAEKSKTEKMAI